MKNRLNINKKYLKLIGIVILLLALPFTLILVKTIQDQRSSAATPDQLETEAGVLSSSGVTKQTDSGASGGSYVFFNKQISGPSPTNTPNNIEYTDYRIIDDIPNLNLTGSDDESNRINNWILSKPNGTSKTAHARYIFPAGTILYSRAIHLGGKNHVTIKGQGETTVLKHDGSHDGDTGPLVSGFITGRKWNDGSHPGSTDIAIEGFKVVGTRPVSNGQVLFSSTWENQSGVEARYVTDLKVSNFTVDAVGGDLMRIRTADGVQVNNCRLIRSGRQGISIIVGSNILVENCDFENVGYFVLDIEPNTTTESVSNVVFRNNTYEQWGPNVGYGSGFFAMGKGPYLSISNIEVSGNTCTEGITYNSERLSVVKVRVGWDEHGVRNPPNGTQLSRIKNLKLTNNKCLFQNGVPTLSGALINIANVDGLDIRGNVQAMDSGNLYGLTGNTDVLQD